MTAAAVTQLGATNADKREAANNDKRGAANIGDDDGKRGATNDDKREAAENDKRRAADNDKRRAAESDKRGALVDKKEGASKTIKHHHHLRDRSELRKKTSFNDQFDNPASSKSYYPHLQFFQDSLSNMTNDPQNTHDYMCDLYELALGWYFSGLCSTLKF